MCDFKISIIVPVYNVEIYLQKAFSSLLEQTIGFENLQIIFIDDCSTDSSMELCRRFADGRPNVSVLRTDKNSRRAGRPRNIGMTQTNAPYLMFLDPDDYYDKDACRFLYDMILKSDADIVSGLYTRVTTDGLGNEQMSQSFDIDDDVEYKLPQDIDRVVTCCGMFQAKIYKNQLIREKNLLFPEYMAGEDTVFLFSYFLLARKAVFTVKNIYFYRIRDKGDKSVSFITTEDFFNEMNRCHIYCRDLFERQGHAEAFCAISNRTADDYTMKMIDSDLDEHELSNILCEWRWLYFYSEDASSGFGAYSNTVIAFLRNENFLSAAEELVALRPLRQYICRLEQWHSNSEAEKRLMEIYHSKSWHLIEIYKRFMDTTFIGGIFSHIRDRFR